METSGPVQAWNGIAKKKNIYMYIYTAVALFHLLHMTSLMLATYKALLQILPYIYNGLKQYKKYAVSDISAFQLIGF